MYRIREINNPLFSDLPVQARGARLAGLHSNWSINDTSDTGSNITFETYPTESELTRGAFYQLYSDLLPDHSLYVFELISAKVRYINASVRIYECEGKTYRSFLEDRAAVSFSAYRISFKNLCKLFLAALNRVHPAFSIDDTYIDDVDFQLSSYRFFNFASVFTSDMTNRGFNIYFDNDLRLHASEADPQGRLTYSIVSMPSTSEIEVTSSSGLQIGDRICISPALLSAYITNIAGNIVTIDRDINTELNTSFVQCDDFALCLDDTRVYKTNDRYMTDLALDYETLPAGQLVFTAENVTSITKQLDSFDCSGAVDQEFVLSKLPVIQDGVAVTFSEDTSALFEPCSVLTGDLIDNGRLEVYSVPGHTLASTTHYRDYASTIKTDHDFILGTSFVVQETTGKIGLLCLQNTPADTFYEGLASFVIEGRELKVGVGGSIIEVGYPLLAVRKERNVTSIVGNVVHVDVADGFVVGEAVIFYTSNLATPSGLATVVAVNELANTITVDVAVTYTAGLHVIQQADYLLKLSYKNGVMTWEAKDASDREYTILYQQSFALQADLTLRLYINEEQSVSFDNLSIIDDLDVRLSRQSADGSTRELSLASSGVASYLNEDALLEERDDGKYSIKFNVTSALVLGVVSKINSSQYVLIDVDGVNIGDRVLIARNLAYVAGIDIATNTVLLDRDVEGILPNDTFIVSTILPAKGEILTITYRFREDLVYKYCSCLSSGVNRGITTYTIDAREGISISYDVFRDEVEGLLERYCLPQVQGSVQIAIDVVAPYPSEYVRRDFGRLEIPHVGQRVKIHSSVITELDGQTAYITGITSTETSEKIMMLTVTVGNEYNMLRLLAQQILRRQKSVKLINDTLSKYPQTVCTQIEDIVVSDNLAEIIETADHRLHLNNGELGVYSLSSVNVEIPIEVLMDVLTGWEDAKAWGDTHVWLE